MPKFGFWDSVNSDRPYTSSDLAGIFDGILTDGVLTGVGDALSLEPHTGDTDVILKSGRLWANGVWGLNSDDYILTVQTPEVVLDRIDLVLVEIDNRTSYRSGRFYILTGTPATDPVEPVFTDPEDVHTYILWSILVPGGSTSSDEYTLTNRIGVDGGMPIATGVLESYNLDRRLASWDAAFTTWFNEIKDQLSTDAAGNLQNQIDGVKDDLPALNLLLNTGFESRLIDYISPVFTNSGGYIDGGPDLWKVFLGSNGSWQMRRTSNANALPGSGLTHCLELNCTTPRSSLATGSYLGISQPIPGRELKMLEYGTPNAKDVTVSFWFRANKTGTYYVELQIMGVTPSTNTRRAFQYSTPDESKLITVTFSGNTSVAIPDTMEEGLRFNIFFMAGTILSSGVYEDGWNTDTAQRLPGISTDMGISTSDYVQIGGIGLYAGSYAPAFLMDYRYDKIQEYIDVAEFSLTSYVYASSGTARLFDRHKMRAPMTITPTARVLSPFSVSNCSYHSVITSRTVAELRVTFNSTGVAQCYGGRVLLDGRI